METRKIYITEENTVKIQCPKCGRSKRFMAEKFKDRGKAYKIRCICQNVFAVSLEFRRAYRKRSYLEGYYSLKPECEKWKRMDVEDISIKGNRFMPLNRNTLCIGDKIKVKFILDNKKHSKIETEAIVKWIKDKHIGCEFVGADQYSQNLGFYLMP